jgi:hypothetical protein
MEKRVPALTTWNRSPPSFCRAASRIAVRWGGTSAAGALAAIQKIDQRLGFFILPGANAIIGEAPRYRS